MTHTRTTTDVVLRTYPARFGHAPSIAAIDFASGGIKRWRITGHWTTSERLSRRRLWTVRRDLLADNPGTSDDWTAALRTQYPGIVKDSTASAIGAVLVRTGGSDAVVITIEEHHRR